MDAKYWHKEWLALIQRTFEQHLNEARVKQQQQRIHERFMAQITQHRQVLLHWSKQVTQQSPSWQAPVWQQWQPVQKTNHLSHIGQFTLQGKRERFTMLTLLLIPAGRPLLVRARRR